MRNNTTTQHAIFIDDEAIPFTPDDNYEYTMTTSQVANGYGVKPGTIRKHLHYHDDELIQGKHFASVTNSNAGLQRIETHWTKRGIIRLGFFIRSERAKRFRDLAEDIIIAPIDTVDQKTALPTVAEIIAKRLDSFEIKGKASISVYDGLCQIYRKYADPVKPDATADKPSFASYPHPDSPNLQEFVHTLELDESPNSVTGLELLFEAYINYCKSKSAAPYFTVPGTFAKAFAAIVGQGRRRRGVYQGKRQIAYAGIGIRTPKTEI